jgi:hypothetical protein
MHKFCNKEGYKIIDVYCNQCKQIRNHWYSHASDLEYYPDDNKTKICYEDICSDFEEACKNENIQRIDWIMKTFNIHEYLIGECYIKYNNVAEHLNTQYKVPDWAKK